MLPLWSPLGLCTPGILREDRWCRPLGVYRVSESPLESLCTPGILREDRWCRLGWGWDVGSFCPVGCRNAEDPLGGSVVPRLAGRGYRHSPVRLVWDSVALEGFGLLELLTTCSRSGVSTEGNRLVLRRRLADYQAHPSSGARSREEDERRQ